MLRAGVRHLPRRSAMSALVGRLWWFPLFYPFLSLDRLAPHVFCPTLVTSSSTCTWWQPTSHSTGFSGSCNFCLADRSCSGFLLEVGSMNGGKGRVTVALSADVIPPDVAELAAHLRRTIGENKQTGETSMTRTLSSLYHYIYIYVLT
jgi:hypothetical protein